MKAKFILFNLILVLGIFLIRPSNAIGCTNGVCQVGPCTLVGLTVVCRTRCCPSGGGGGGQAQHPQADAQRPFAVTAAQTEEGLPVSAPVEQTPCEVEQNGQKLTSIDYVINLNPETQEITGATQNCNYNDGSP